MKKKYCLVFLLTLCTQIFALEVSQKSQPLSPQARRIFQVIKEQLYKNIDPQNMGRIIADILYPNILPKNYKRRDRLQIAFELLSDPTFAYLQPTIVKIIYSNPEFAYATFTPLQQARILHYPKNIIDLLIPYDQITLAQVFSAIQDKDYDELDKLLKNFNINTINSDGTSALFFAITEKNTDVIKKLLNKGANQNLQTFKEKLTALMTAIIGDDPSIAELLLTYKPINAPSLIKDKDRPSDKTYSEFTAEERQLLLRYKYKPNLNLIDSHGQTALILAVRKHQTDLVEKIIKAGADINIQDDFGFTALLHAINNQDQLLVKMLLDAGAFVKLEKPSRYAPLSIAVDRSNKPIIDMIFHHFNELSLVDLQNSLVLAIETRNLEVIENLLQRGVNPDFVLNNNETPLMVAVTNFKKEEIPTGSRRKIIRTMITQVDEYIVQLLICYGAVVSEKNTSGKNVLQLLDEVPNISAESIKSAEKIQTMLEGKLELEQQALQKQKKS